MAATSHQFAGLGSRAIAAIVDAILLFVANGIVGAASFVAIGLDMGSPVVSLLNLIVFFGYFIVLEAYNNGQTVGKMIVNIRVRKSSGGELDLGGSIVRNVLRIVDILPFFYIIGIILVLVTDDEQRLGDLVADTVVVEA